MENMSDGTNVGTTGAPAVPSDALSQETVPGGLRLKDLMTRDVAVVHPDDRLQTAAEKMKELHVGALPVDDGTRLLGMITERDILNAGRRAWVRSLGGESQWLDDGRGDLWL